MDPSGWTFGLHGFYRRKQSKRRGRKMEAEKFARPAEIWRDSSTDFEQEWDRENRGGDGGDRIMGRRGKEFNRGICGGLEQHKRCPLVGFAETRTDSVGLSSQ